MYNSPGWRTYIALHATFLSLSDGLLRDQVQAAWPSPSTLTMTASRMCGSN